MLRNLALRVSLFVIAVLALGCGGGSSSPTEPVRRDSLTLLSVEPAQAAGVVLGKRVPVRARFRYAFKEPGGGKIGLLAYPLPLNLPIITDPLIAQAVVATQEGEVTMAFDLLLDKSSLQSKPKTIVMSFALFPQGQANSTTDVEVRYPVNG